MRASLRSVSWVAAVLAFSLAVFFLSPIKDRIFANPLVGRQAPPVRSPVWLNSGPLDWASLRGKVVLVDMWTFG